MSAAPLHAAQLQAALHRCRAQAESGALLARVAEALGYSVETLAPLVNQLLGQPVYLRAELAALTPVFDSLPFSACLEQQVLLAKEEGGWLLVADDPWQSALVAKLARTLGSLPSVVWAQADDILWALQRSADTVRAVSGFDSGALAGADDETPEISLESIERTSNQVVRFVDAAILDAWKSGASDVHLETHRNVIVVKYRLDGVLVEVGRFDDARRIEEVLNRVKVIAGLDISERRVPQDGRFRARLKERSVDFRVSIMPSIHGEDAVIRVLDKSHLHEAEASISLQGLGLPEDVRDTITLLAQEPHGMLLVTGPTGSGKTTTLYAVLMQTRSGLEKIITIEDPVEYELPGVLQIPVNEKKGLSFSRGLRSILRHDPDRLLVGEIRDPETAEIAVQAALTGHGVLTTVHANNGFDAVNRFIHMGVDLYAFSAAINGIVSQRLMRKVCESCAEPVQLSAGFMLNLSPDGLGSNVSSGLHTPRHGRGCPACRMTGYKGRFAVSEVLVMDDEIRQLIISRAPIQALKQAAHARGMLALRDRAIQAVLDGLTTEQEFKRVVAAH